MVVDIVWNNNTVAMITMENGIKNMEIRVFPPATGDSWTFLPSDFTDAIEEGKQTLINSLKND